MVCIGTVRMWLSYVVRQSAHWIVVIYARQAMPQIIGNAAFTLGPGSYYWDFPIRKQFRRPFSLCLIAGPDPSAGISCARLG
jgi:hypothetical protein